MDNNSILLNEVLPDLAEKMKQAFIYNDRIDLNNQVDKLKIVALCECGQDNCGSFYTCSPPNEDIDYYFEGFVIIEGLVAVNVYDGIIVYIEILPSQYGEYVHKRIYQLMIERKGI